ncbi:MAG: 23S rRNA (pseudouridine(1915)-N(3))-methyltransferase RlmH [Hyphomicrobiaceae bacterium]
MKLLVCAVGRMKLGPERDLAERYRSRAEALGRRLLIDGPRLIELPESRASSAEARKSEERDKIIEAANDARLIALDEGGASLTSRGFADRLMRLRADQTKAVAFIIGGADGLDGAFLNRGAEIISLSAMTFPHQIARVLLLEQIYRAATLAIGHPYHRA